MAIAILNNANTQLCRLIKGRAACCDLPIQVTKIIGESTGQRLNTLVKLPLMSGFYHYLMFCFCNCSSRWRAFSVWQVMVISIAQGVILLS